MIPHDKYFKIQVDNILLAAKMLIENLSYVDEGGKTQLFSDYSKSGLIKAINILKHQMQPSNE